ncbi:MAG: LysR family transcriptional regulator [bacterium]|nr:LysR family transcriptional regulator [bacterium]
MEWLNYHHLLYFWLAAREGGVTRASEELRLSQSTVSAQIRLLESALGDRLFVRRGRRLELTELGRLVYRYAEEIFGLGRELLDAVKGRPTGRPTPFVVGVADVVPKLMAHRLLAPALQVEPPVHLVCREGKPSELLAALALHRLDLVLADAPVGPGIEVKAYDHLLGESPIEVWAAPALAASLRRRFPRSLDGAPMLLPTVGTQLRRSLDQWFDEVGVRPVVAAEIEDSALLKVFGAEGRGAFPVCAAIGREVRRQFRVARVGVAGTVRERYYAISIERRLTHPAVVALSRAARASLES